MFEWQDDEQGNMWWYNISGPKRYRKELANCILNGQCVVADVDSEDMAFRRSLEDRLHRQNSNLRLEWVSPDRFANATQLYKYLLNIGHAVFDAAYETPLLSMAKHHDLSGQVFFLICDDRNRNWMQQMARQFQPYANADSLVLIFLDAAMSEEDNIKGWTGVRQFRRRDWITYYDVQYFALLCLQSLPLNEAQRYYTATLVSKLAGDDGHLAERLAVSQLYASPEEFLATLAKENASFPEILARQDRIKEIIWEAQMQNVLPITEHVRRYLIRKYRTSINQYLTCRTVQDEYGNRLQQPEDMELRHLHYHFKPPYSIFTEQDLAWLKTAYTARNAISHLRCLDKHSLDSLFQLERVIKATV